MGRLFKRVVEVTLSQLEPSVQTMIIRDMHVRFTIDKTLENEPNRLTLEITNLAQQSRQFVQHKPIKVAVDAGYEGFPLARVFLGDAIWATSVKSDVVWTTTIQAGDGQRALKGRLNKTYSRNTNAQRIVVDLLRAMRFGSPPNISQINHVFGNGATVTGNAALQLTRILAIAGFEWSVQDDKIAIVPLGGIQPGEAVLISPDTGMIGSPEFGAPRDEKSPPVVSVRTLLEPRLVPGGRCAIRASGVEGVYKIESLSHVGDNRGSEWETSIEATAIPGASL